MDTDWTGVRQDLNADEQLKKALHVAHIEVVNQLEENVIQFFGSEEAVRERARWYMLEYLESDMTADVDSYTYTLQTEYRIRALSEDEVLTQGYAKFLQGLSTVGRPAYSHIQAAFQAGMQYGRDYQEFLNSQ